jgi:chromosome segregation ATPase
MEKKKLKKSPLLIKKKILKTLTPNDFGAVLEDINDKFTVMVEGLDMVNGRMDRLENRFDGMENRFDRLESKFDRLENKVDGMEIEMKSIFKTTLGYLSRIDKDLKEIKEEISRLKKEKAEQEYAKSIEGRVQKIQFELLAIRNELGRKKM